jgi:hypothetical protein
MGLRLDTELELTDKMALLPIDPLTLEQMAVRNQEVYIKNLQAAENSRFAVMHISTPLVDPDDGKVLGYEGIYTGTALVKRAGQPAKSVLIDPLPYARPPELVQLRSEYPRIEQQSHGDWVVWNDAREVVRRTRTLESIGVYQNAIFDLAGDAKTTPEALYGLRMKANLFPTLGVSPMLGRNILPEEDQPDHPDVMILSYGLWTRRFHADPSIVGRIVTENGHGCLVIGVMPRDFNFPMRRAAAHTPSPYVEFWAAPFKVPANPDAGLGAVARLRPGVSLDQTRQDLASRRSGRSAL